VYDPATGYLTQTTHGFDTPDASTATLAYDAVGNITSATNANGQTTTFEYNALNQLVKTTAPAPFSFLTHFRYDANGNLIQTDRQAKTTTSPGPRPAAGAVLFAASLHFIMGPAGMHSFGHAAYFGLGAYGAALLVRSLNMPMEVALLVAPALTALGAFVYGWFCVRLSGVYLAMLTLAFAQITWAICYQWDAFTGGSNGLTGVWPAGWLADKRIYYYLTLALVVGGVLLMHRMLYSPFGYAMRAARDSVLRSDAIGINVKRMQWVAFVMACSFAGLAGALYAFSKGSISPESLHVSKSIDGLVMVLLGGVQTLLGPVVGAVTFTWLHDTVARNTDYWRAMLGAIILILVLLFPQGIAGFVKQLVSNRRDAMEVQSS
jgi:branched-chain amino acid transport system permease protein